MTTTRSILDLLPYLIAAVFLYGLFRRLHRWSRAKAPVAPLFPLPDRPGRIWRNVAAEICFLRGRRPDALPSRLPAWIFHAALVLLLCGHLRTVTDFPRLWAALGLTPAGVDRLAAVSGGLIGLAALGATLSLAARRACSPRLRQITGLADVGVLVLLLAVMGSGLAMRLGPAMDLTPVRAYFADLLALRPRPMPDVPGFALHFLLAQALIVSLPFGKLLHAAGIAAAKADGYRDNASQRPSAPL